MDELAKMFVGIGNNLAQVIASQTFEFWNRKDFRLYVEFHKLSQTEQDRMFNELEVSLIGLFVLHLDVIQKDIDKPFQKVIQMIQKEVIAGFMDLMENSGVEKKFLKQWNVLIDMRLKEYREHFSLAIEESKKMKEFIKDGEDIRNTWAAIETITLDCLSHLRRGDVNEGDPLWKLLRKWIITVDTTYIAPIASLAQKA